MKLDQAKIFIFQRYAFNHKTGQATFYYSFDNKINFQETLDFSACQINTKKLNNRLLERALFNLHLALGVGYYKAYCPKKIEIQSGKLNSTQAKFWNKLYERGLGEFFYRHKINFHNLIKFPIDNSTLKPIRIKFKDRCLLPIGGGKDSCLSAEKLKELGQTFSLISLRDSKVQQDTAKIIGAPRLIIGRKMDPQLFDLNKKGANNGHIPISAIYSWVSVVAAILSDYKYIIFSNEHSANFGNVKYLGKEINHQYSKSFEFETDFANYLHNFLTPDLEYFSLLRPYSELKIAHDFSRYTQYFSAFSSCNKNFKINNKNSQKHSQRWCGECPKCAFSFAIFSAWNSPTALKKIFNANLLNNKKLLPLFQELWGEEKIKPFDCVGTPTETQMALMLLSENVAWQKFYIVKYFRKNILPKIKGREKLLLTELSANEEQAIPSQFKKTLFLGFGQEGHFAFNYWRQKNPHTKVWIADTRQIKAPNKYCLVSTGKNYLKNLESFDLIIKSPGISQQIPEIALAKQKGIRFTSITEIFLENCQGTIIGVTGTKGKSTTATLIYRSLKAAGKTVYLIGNIGENPLKYLDSSTKKDYFVYELSSYQLENLKISPHLAIIINIFPDHLPYHAGFQNYYQAKANITRWQTPQDYFIYNGEFSLIKKLANKTQAQQIDYSQKWSIKKDNFLYENKILMPLAEIKLLGKHNLKNITAAATVLKVLKIPLTALRQGTKNFSGLKHRLELVSSKNGIYFYDDAISTTPESTLVAIEYLQEKLETIILGGEDRGYNFKLLVKKLKKINIANIIFFPDSGVKIKKELIKIYGTKPLPNILETKQMTKAVIFAARKTTLGHVVLLSTASPSYSLFKNFQEKGNLFKKAIKNL